MAGRAAARLQSRCSCKAGAFDNAHAISQRGPGRLPLPPARARTADAADALGCRDDGEEQDLVLLHPLLQQHLGEARTRTTGGAGCAVHVRAARHAARAARGWAGPQAGCAAQAAPRPLGAPACTHTNTSRRQLRAARQPPASRLRSGPSLCRPPPPPAARTWMARAAELPEPRIGSMSSTKRSAMSSGSFS